MTNKNALEIRWIQFRLALINSLIQAITRQEASATWVGGYGARGELDPYRERLLIKSNQLLDKLQDLDGTLPFQFR